MLGEVEIGSNTYPLDALARSRLGIPFTVAFGSLAVLVAVLDFARVGLHETGVPYNYPLLLGVVYLVVAASVLKRYYAILDRAKAEIVDVLERTAVDGPLFDRDSDVEPETVVREMDGVLEWSFRPAYVLGGGLIGGAFAVAVVWWLGALEYYPYVLSVFLYGAGHGLFYAPVLGTLVLVWQTSTKYIVDIDILDPDGVGGYQRVGDGIVSLITYGILLVTLDALILSSVTFLDEPAFQLAVGALYVGMMVFLLGVAVVGTVRLRRQLLEVREWKTSVLRTQFSAVERQYYAKLDRGESPEPESQHIDAMTTMFDQLQSMELWPINLVSLARLGASAGSSAVIVGYQFGLYEIPV